MLSEDGHFTQAELEKRLTKYVAKGRGLSASFVNWFLENVYRLDGTDADDALVDASNDKGVDAIYVDHNFLEIHIIQGKLRNDYKKTIGDVLPKEVEGTRQQFTTVEALQSILDGGANNELKKVILRESLLECLETGYKVKGILVSNSNPDNNAAEYFAANPNVEVWGRDKILDHIVDYEADEGVNDTFAFDVSYAKPFKISTGGAEVYVFAALASDLVSLKGIADASLFSQNVRLSLGRTAVNKSIADSIGAQPEHKYFPLYHNGVIILCDKVDASSGEKLVIQGYTVVNGAQSITTLYENQKKITGDLKVFARVIALNDADLARRITKNSNNQNPTKPRDLKSGDALMVRLQAEFEAEGLPYFFEVKRGEKAPKDAGEIISNDEAGRMLLAFDLGEPESAHQVYKVFDEKYGQIFGRREVNAHRIAFLWEIMKRIEGKMNKLKSAPMASYALTRYFLLYVVGKIL